MKSSHAALAVVGLALVGLWYAAGGTAPPQASATESRVSAPLAHDNLTVYFVHGPDAITNAKIGTLQEALDAGWVVVHETGDVNTLAVENLSSEYELFIQEGDMIKGGKQDRMIAVDMLVPPHSGRVPFPAHCVESGRWTNRGTEAATHFTKSDQFAVGNGLRIANGTGQQNEVWKNVKVQQDNLSANLNVKVNAEDSETSLQRALEHQAVRAKVAEFEQTLRAAGEKRPNVIGVVFVLNGQVRGHEEYGSNALFLKAWPKLLRSAAADAVAEKTAKATPPAPSVREVERFLAYGGQGQADIGDRSTDSEPPRVSGIRHLEYSEADRQRLSLGPDISRRARGIPDGVSNGPGGITENREVRLDPNTNLNDIPLSELLRTLSNQHNVRFEIMEEHFKAEMYPGDIKEAKAKLAASNLRGLRLSTFLDVVLLSMNATYVVRSDHIEITTFNRRLDEIERDQQRVRVQTEDLIAQRQEIGCLQMSIRSQDAAIQALPAAGRIDETRLRQIADSWSGQGPQDRARQMEELLRQLPPRYRQMVEEYFRQLNRANGQPANSDDLTRAIDAIRRQQIRDDEQARATQNAANPAGNAPNGAERRPDLRVFGSYDISGIGMRPVAPNGGRLVITGDSTTNDRVLLNNPEPAPRAANAATTGNRLNVNRVDGAAGLVTESRDPSRQNAVIHKSFIKK